MGLRKFCTFEILVRILADVLIFNFCYLAALFLYCLWHAFNGIGFLDYRQLLSTAAIYGQTFLLLSFIAIAVYCATSIYTRGRFYRARLKALAIFQAVSMSYLLFAFALYLAMARDWLLQPPRLALFMAWAMTVALTWTARLWASLWRKVMKRESPQLRKMEQEGPIRHILVIGGAGYIGSILCRQLLQKGYSVRVLDALLYGADSVAELLEHPHFELIEGDSRDVSDLFKAMLDMDAVVHLGEIVGDPACALDEKLTVEINMAATHMVAEAARGYGIKRFIYASSCSVYGAGSDILNEKSGLKPVSLYARAKIASEKALLALKEPNFHPVILRFATVFGLSHRPRFDLVINLLTAKAVKEGQITIFGGDQWRPFVHVADVARAIVKCIEAPLESIDRQIMNVGSDEQNYTIAQIGDLIQRLIPTARLVTREVDGDKRDYHVSFEKIRRQLNFTPRYTVEDGIREIEAALMEGRIIDYQDMRYSNYRTLSDADNQQKIRSTHIPEFYAPSSPEIIIPSLAPGS